MVNTAYIMSSTVKKIVENFPFPTILPIIGEPNYDTIAKVHFKLSANSASVQSNLGDGNIGLLYLTVSPAVYNNLCVTDFIPPANPGATALITVRATAAVIANKRRAFANTTKLFKQYDSSNKALKKMLPGAVEKMFVRSLQTKYVGYLHVHSRHP